MRAFLGSGCCCAGRCARDRTRSERKCHQQVAVSKSLMSLILAIFQIGNTTTHPLEGQAAQLRYGMSAIAISPIPPSRMECTIKPEDTPVDHDLNNRRARYQHPHLYNNLSTSSAILKQLVNPGLSIPNKLTNPSNRSSL